MSVVTRSDELIAGAKFKLAEAKKMLTEAMDEGTWGSDEFKPKYKAGVHESILKIEKIRQKV